MPQHEAQTARIDAHVRVLVSALLELEGLPRDFWGSLSVSVQGGNPSTIEYKFTRKVSPGNREPHEHNGGAHDGSGIGGRGR